jgi:hypothetical protein
MLPAVLSALVVVLLVVALLGVALLGIAVKNPAARLGSEKLVCRTDDGIGLAIAGMNCAATFIPAAAFAAAVSLFSNLLSWKFPGAGVRIFKTPAPPAFFPTAPTGSSSSPEAVSASRDCRCAAANVAENPPLRCTAFVWPTEVATGSAEILFELVSRIGITMSASPEISGGSADTLAFVSPRSDPHPANSEARQTLCIQPNPGFAEKRTLTFVRTRVGKARPCTPANLSRALSIPAA